METSRIEALKESIQKQYDLNFSAEEIQQNLLDKGFTLEEITAAGGISAAEENTKKSGGGAGIISIIFSIYFIVRGLILLNDGRQGWGMFLLLGGLVGLVFKIISNLK